MLPTDRGLDDDPTTEHRKVVLDLLSKINESQGAYPTDQTGVTMTGGKAPIKIVGTIGNVINKTSIAPIGAGITETGQNSYGYWTKTPTGTGVGILDCWWTTPRITTSILLVAPIYYGALAITFPCPFLALTEIDLTARDSLIANTFSGGAENVTITGFTGVIMGFGPTGNGCLGYHARGIYAE